MLTCIAGCNKAKPATEAKPENTANSAEIDRTALPIQAPKYKKITELDARNATAPPRFEVKAPKDAPNVVIVLIDDIGFGTAGSFGGPIDTPTIDRLAKNGLSYNQFHTTAGPVTRLSCIGPTASRRRVKCARNGTM